MNILALDTATEISSVAVVSDNHLRCEYNLRVTSGHAGSLLPLIDQALNQAALQRADIDLIAVGTGPGSFTGIRIAIATAKALARALDRPLSGHSTLDIIAHGITPANRPVMPLIDARKGEVFGRIYTPTGKAATPCLNLRPANLAEIITEPTILLGNALPLYHELLTTSLGDNAIPAPQHTWHPRASILATMAASQGTPQPAAPLYIRPSDATLLLRSQKTR